MLWEEFLKSASAVFRRIVYFAVSERTASAAMAANGNVDKWVGISQQCKYLPEPELKQLCDLVCDLLLEESNVQPGGCMWFDFPLMTSVFSIFTCDCLWGYSWAVL